MACARDESTLVQQVLSSQMEKAEQWQYHELFETKFVVKDRACHAIIDSESCNNSVSSDLVDKLELPTQPHPHPYYIEWFNSCGKFKASENNQGNEEEEKKDEEQKDLSIAPCMLEECLIDQAPTISEDEKKGKDNGATTAQEYRMHISNSLSMAIKKCSSPDVVIHKDKFNTLYDKVLAWAKEKRPSVMNS
uniref:Retrotransposon protein, putative, Ty3-gypsy sub-class n=2 Tax=Oryza sativa subsp. japonica TaxID=39947 RepID=Q10H61_ORYSJ|nr:retrotransposon protein, putative, Ty3-gypsy sub-class [Oryza sativa Japonica Group]ABF97483.1 retrotransposon protein, putative, Ty3-gypsy subclass [Oryza sativa Japonica Group]